MNDGTKRVFYWIAVILFGLSFLGLMSLILLANVSHGQEEKPDEKQFAQVSVGTRSGMASGTVIHRSGQTYWIITNQHVVEPHVEDSKKLWVLCQQKRFQGKLVYAAVARQAPDLALVKVDMDGIDLKPVKVAEQPLQIGDAVYRLGKGTGFWKGKVWKFSEFRTTYGTVLQTDIPYSANGDSGSGLFNSKGELVGVHFGVIGLTGDPKDLDEEFPKSSSGDVHLPDVKKVLDKYLPKS